MIFGLRCRSRFAVIPFLFGLIPLSAVAGFEVTGLIEPVWQATLAPTILGRVESIEVKESENVEAGAVLLRFERKFEELDARRRRIVAESTVELDLARAKLEVLQSQYESTVNLYENTGTVSKEEMEKARLEFSLAKAEAAQLEQREEIEQLEWELAREQVANREIRSPRAGAVVEIYPEVGEVCEPRQPIVRVVDASTVIINLDVDALKTARVAAGVKLPVRIDAPEGEIAVEGRVEYVSVVVDGGSGLRRMRITIENPTGKILPGLPARVMMPES